MKKGLFFALSFIGQVGIATAVPLVALALLGRYLDQRFDSAPKLFIVGIILAAGASILILRQITKKMITEIKKLD